MLNGYQHYSLSIWNLRTFYKNIKIKLIVCSFSLLRTQESRWTAFFWSTCSPLPAPRPKLHSNYFSLTFVSCGSAALRAALIIQNWYRGYSARLKARQRYALTIFQSIEYADEQGQLQVCFASLSLLLLKGFSSPLAVERMTIWVLFKLRNLGERV